MKVKLSCAEFCKSFKSIKPASDPMQYMSKHPPGCYQAGHEHSAGMFETLAHYLGNQGSGDDAGDQDGKKLDNAYKQISWFEESRFLFHLYSEFSVSLRKG
jgi:hypothetical protein